MITALDLDSVSDHFADWHSLSLWVDIVKRHVANLYHQSGTNFALWSNRRCFSHRLFHLNWKPNCSLLKPIDLEKIVHGMTEMLQDPESSSGHLLSCEEYKAKP
jgi:hypothetical protein